MKDDQSSKKVLFVCTGNSCRSQMAEGWCRHVYGDRIQAYSAGLKAQGINPLAVKVMDESGVDISTQRSDDLDPYQQQQFDLVVTLCGHAHEHCPVVADSPLIHQPFDDPPRMASELSDSEQQLNCYRQVRDEIQEWIGGLENLINLHPAKESISC
ncbi:MAG: arsenate reductase ArsC [Motiliproteus sp.]|nr:arsenate reductase ArsC [Motiliproteus sp.]MCW9054249.1 arsenate reductase ArsC [Motiliproteus sp.]